MARDIPNAAGHSGVTALEGPPWMRTTRDISCRAPLLAAQKPALNVEAVVRPLKILGLPHVGDSAALLLVSWRHFRSVQPRSPVAFQSAALCGREFAILGNSKVGKLPEA